MLSLENPMSPGMLVDSRIIADSLIDLFRTVYRLHGQNSKVGVMSGLATMQNAT